MTFECDNSMKTDYVNKGLVFGIIVLFICMSITPSYAVDKVKKSSIPITDSNILYVDGTRVASGFKIDNITVDKDNDYGYGTNIDSNIHLTSKHLTLFRKSVRHIDVPQIKEFVQQVIYALELKGNVDSKDIEEIVNILNLNAKIKGIHFLCLLRSTGTGIAYARGILPFIFDILFHNLFIDETYIGPAILVNWDSTNADTYINSRKIYEDDSQKGYIFGFLGLTLAGGTWPCYYNAIGLCNFVIITELDSKNKNINNNGY